MIRKRNIYILGLITLFLFPVPAYFAVKFFYNVSLVQFLHFESLELIPVLYGLQFGVIYAFFASLILKAPVFERIPLPIDRLIKDLRINYGDALFLSLCAGIGEELLFRNGVQQFLGIWSTSILFVAIHGYFSIRTLIRSLYGLVVLPFILLISYGFDHFGLWFCISAHFAYDLTLFIAIIEEKEGSPSDDR